MGFIAMAGVGFVGLMELASAGANAMKGVRQGGWLNCSQMRRMHNHVSCNGFARDIVFIPLLPWAVIMAKGRTINIYLS
jgi:hypothetical protein